MSHLSTAVVKVVPAAADGLSVTAGSSSWANGAWVELIASASANLAIVGCVAFSPAETGIECEIEVGVGGSGNEVPLGYIRWYHGNPGNGGPAHLSLPLGIGGILAGQRVSLRVRSAAISSVWEVVIVYVENPDSESITTSQLSSVPSAANSVSVTPNSSAWANSSWVEIAAALSDPSGIVGFTVSPGVWGVDYELDVGVGAASSEQVITTLRSVSATTPADTGNRRSHVMLPAVYFISGGRVSVRLRKAGTDTTDWDFAMLKYGDLLVTSRQKVTQVVLKIGRDEYIDDDTPPTANACTGGGAVATGTNPTDGTSLATATSLHAWFETTIGGTTYRWSQTAINVTTAKEPRVHRWGKCYRGLPDERGGFQAVSVDIDLIDHDNLLRTLHTTQTLKGQTGKVYIADLATILAAGNPQIRFSGVVADFRPVQGGYYQLTLEDPLSTLFSAEAQEVLLPPELIAVSDNTADQGLRAAPAPVIYGSLSDEDEAVPHGAIECPYIGAETLVPALGNLYKFLVCISPTHNVQSIFLADPASGTPPTRRSKAGASLYGTELFVPHHAGWFLPNDYSVTAAERWTFFYLEQHHPAADLAREGRIPITANVCGREETGDATGDTITNPALITLHALNTLWARIVGDNNWPALLTRDSASVFDSDAFAVVEGICDDRGYLWAFMLGHSFKQITLRDFLELVYLCGDFELFINRFGQVSATMIDRTSAYSSASSYTAVSDILKNSFEIDPKSDAVENLIRYVYKRKYVKTLEQPTPVVGSRLPADSFQEDWFSGLQEDSDSTSITALGGSPKGERPSRVLEMEFVRDQDTADDLAAQRLALRKNPNGRPEASFDVTLMKADTLELGAIITVTHPQGLGASGWVDVRCQVRGIEEDWNDMTARLTVRDVDDLLA